MVSRKTFQRGEGVATKFTDRLLNAQELPTNDDRLPTSDDHKICFCVQAIELSVIDGTPHIPTSARPWAAAMLCFMEFSFAIMLLTIWLTMKAFSMICCFVFLLPLLESLYTNVDFQRYGIKMLFQTNSMIFYYNESEYQTIILFIMLGIKVLELTYYFMISIYIF